MANGFIFAEAKVSSPEFFYIDLMRQPGVKEGLEKIFNVKNPPWQGCHKFMSMKDFAEWYQAVLSPRKSKSLDKLGRQFNKIVNEQKAANLHVTNTEQAGQLPKSAP